VTTAIGYLILSGPMIGIQDLEIVGCASSAPGAPGLQLGTLNVTGTGTYTLGTVVYTDGMGKTFTNVPAGQLSEVVGQLGSVGQTIQGTFQVVVAVGSDPGQASHKLSGSFDVCRVPDRLGGGG
jgi:hypothetical protein